MKMIPHFKTLLRGAALAACLAPAAAFAGDRVGVLECDLSGNGPSLLIENQTLDCVYEDDDEGAKPAHYQGTLTKVGANLTVNGPGDFLWIVGAATGHIGPGALAGSYAGPGATAKVGVGAGGAILVGGSNDTVSLQPFSFEGGEGVGVTAGIQSLTLAYLPDAPPHRVRHKHAKHR